MTLAAPDRHWIMFTSPIETAASEALNGARVRGSARIDPNISERSEFQLSDDSALIGLVGSWGNADVAAFPLESEWRGSS